MGLNVLLKSGRVKAPPHAAERPVKQSNGQATTMSAGAIPACGTKNFSKTHKATTMITVQRENGDVAFINEHECTNCGFNRESRKFFAIPIPCNGLEGSGIELEDVVSVTYNNEAQPTNMVFVADKSPADYEKLPVDALADEIDRLDGIAAKKTSEIYGYRRGKSGSSARFMNVCRKNQIETIGQLIKMGRKEFDRLRNMGRSCSDKVAEALNNMYGIKW